MATQRKTPKKAAPESDLDKHFAALRREFLPGALYALRVAERKGLPAPYMEVKTRVWQRASALLCDAASSDSADRDAVLSVTAKGAAAKKPSPRSRRADSANAPRQLTPCGRMYGPKLRCVLPVIRDLLEPVRTQGDDIPMGLEKIIKGDTLLVNGVTLPLSEECGIRLSLIFKLQEALRTETLRDFLRVELLAQRVARLSREEAIYWHSWLSSGTPAMNSWTLSGMRVMFAGTARARIEDLEKALEETQIG